MIKYEFCNNCGVMIRNRFLISTLHFCDDSLKIQRLKENPLSSLLFPLLDNPDNNEQIEKGNNFIRAMNRFTSEINLINSIGIELNAGNKKRLKYAESKI